MPRNFDQFHDYWSSLASGEAPESSSFDPVPVLDLLPHLIFVDLLDNPFRVRFRHSGTKFEDIACVDITGRHLDEFSGPLTKSAVDTMTEHYYGCRHSGRPSFGTFFWPDENGRMVNVSFAIFPFKVNGLVRQCIALEDYGDANNVVHSNLLRLPPPVVDETLHPPAAPSAEAQGDALPPMLSNKLVLQREVADLTMVRRLTLS